MIDGGKVIKGLECLAQAKEPTANPCKDCGYSDRPNYAICVKDIASDTIDLLKEQEAKTGHWIDTTKVFGFPRVQCSVCGSEQGAVWMYYCPICGAKMSPLALPASGG